MSEPRKFRELLLDTFWRFLRMVGGLVDFTYEQLPQTGVGAAAVQAAEGEWKGNPPAAPSYANMLHVPEWGKDVGAAVGSIVPNAIALKKEMMQLPLQQAETNLGLDYLKRLQANPNASQYVTSVGPGGTSFSPMPYLNNAFNQSLGNYGPYLPPATNGNTVPSAPTAPSQQVPNNQPAPQSAVPQQQQTIAVPQTVVPDTNFINPNQNPTAPGPTTSAPSVTLGSGYSNAAPVQYSLNDYLGWYKQNHSTDAKSASFGINPVTNSPGVLIRHSDPTVRSDQWIDPGHLAASGYQPEKLQVPANSSLAQQPIPSALGVAAAAPTAAAISSNITSGNPAPQISPLLSAAMNGSSGSQSLPASLAAGTLTPSQVLSVGGPLTASTAPGPTPYQLSPQLGPPRGQLIAPSAPTASAPPAQQVVTPEGQHPVGLNSGGLRGDDYYQKNFGMTQADFVKRAADPHYNQLVGPAKTSPTGYPPSQQYSMTDAQGQTHLYYLDPGNGLPYTVMNQTPYTETHVFPNGTTAEINNAISQENDKLMMEKSLQYGTAGGDWQSLTRDQRESAFRLASSLENSKVDPDFSNKSAKLEQVLDDGRKLNEMISSYATPGDPAALGIRNVAHQAWNDAIQKVGPAVKDITHGLVDWGTGDQRATNLAQQYQQFLNSIRAEQSTRPLPPGVKSTESAEGAVGDLSSPQLPTMIDRYLTTAGQNLSRLVDHAVANQWRVSPSTVLKANAVVAGSNPSVGNDQSMPVRVNSPAEYSRLPKGTWISDGINTARKGYPVQPAQ